MNVEHKLLSTIVFVFVKFELHILERPLYSTLTPFRNLSLLNVFKGDRSTKYWSSKLNAVSFSLRRIILAQSSVSVCLFSNEPAKTVTFFFQSEKSVKTNDFFLNSKPEEIVMLSQNRGSTERVIHGRQI